MGCIISNSNNLLHIMNKEFLVFNTKEENNKENIAENNKENIEEINKEIKPENIPEINAEPNHNNIININEQINNKIKLNEKLENIKNLKRALPLVERSIIYSDKEKYKFKKHKKRSIQLDSINNSFFKEENLNQNHNNNKKQSINNSIRSNFKDIYSEDIIEKNIKNITIKNYSSENSKKSKKNSLFKNSKIHYEYKPLPLLTENDLLFENLFRKKLLKKAEEENFMLNLIHLDLLKIPFPDDLEKYEDDFYTYSQIEIIKKNLEGKFIIEKGIVDSIAYDNIIIFINKSEKKSNHSKSILLENNFISDKEIFTNYVGINFKRIDNDNYGIYYLFAIKA
jgi:hypothetical protein